MKEYQDLVDFERLLSHHDKKLADQLNSQYLQEEWNFGPEKVTLDKSKFKEPPVICGESRMQMAREQKLKYRYLKSELGNSHRKLYRAKAGYIRDRPVTAPDLSMYEEKEEDAPPPEFTAQTAYEIVQRKVKSANAAVGRTAPDLSDKPVIPSPQKVWSAKAVTDAELEETQKNYDLLKFDIETVQGRFDYHKNKEIEYYFPGQMERISKQQEEKEESEAPEMLKKPSRPKKPKITQKEVERLAYPPSRILPSHAKACDARLKQKLIRLAERFRGWHSVKSKKGSHFVLVAPSFENSYHGRLNKKLEESSNVPVKKIKGDFVHRYTKKTEASKLIRQDMRPTTAPAYLQTGEKTHVDETVVSKTESPSESCKTEDTGYGSMDDKLGSSAESLSKSPEVKSGDPSAHFNEPKKGFPKPFEKVMTVKEKKENSVRSTDKSDMDRHVIQKQVNAKTLSGNDNHGVRRPKTSPSSINSKKQEHFAESNKRRENLKAYKDQDVPLLPQSNSSQINKQSDQISVKNKKYNIQCDQNSVKSEHYEKHVQIVTPAKEIGHNIAHGNNEMKLDTKIENYKMELNRYTLEKRASNNQRKAAKSPPPLEFTFTSILDNSEKENFCDVDHTEDDSSKNSWFDSDKSSSPEIQSPRMPEPTVYTRKSKEKIDIENLPVPHLEHSKPKTVSVGNIGKISLLESITESKFWEDMIEETHRDCKKDEVFVEDDINNNCKENELADLKEEDFEDDISNDSGVSGYGMETKTKSRKKKKAVCVDIDDKLMKAKEERLKRQKRVMKGTNFEKMGLSVTKNKRGSRQSSTSSENSNKDQNISKKDSKYSSNSKQKQIDEKNNDLREVNNENINNKQEIVNIQNSKLEEKQKKFNASMKRLVRRMDGTMSTDLRSKMLAAHLS